ncbi:MAG: bifunctional 5,10-methylenetetrahydrofolate dehydrogenase/5,10-methenyltetrahydrofolate cyclohydrolase [Candidatus Curtissbacteria bacterium]|nr:bifunctional 5,10-methylenetetrahydrofolate dehydrogenase/5,10-methenyltetrahydrofolate cyclohydrolase [Candidatus Curtissbacteria bacterium]
MAKLLDGKIVRDKIEGVLKSKIQNLLAAPRLVIIQVGDNPESNTYIAQKIKFGEKIGANIKHLKLPEDVTEKTLNFNIANFNSEKSINGIIIQLPIPENLDKNQIIEAIDPAKDVDCLHSANLKKLMENNPTGLVPATTKGILTLLEHYKINPAGKHVVVVGRSSLVGKPTALAFLNLDATVTVCHSKTNHLSLITKHSDILISAVGKPGLITKNHVSPGQTVVDVGTTVVDGKLKGDVAAGEVEKIVDWISPVPGGVGPMTVASLFQNLLQAYQNQNL